MKPIDRTVMMEKFRNRWVALTDDDRVISSGATLDEAIERARAKGITNPVVTRIPSSRHNSIL